jgi:hypothetical protein
LGEHEGKMETLNNNCVERFLKASKMLRVIPALNLSLGHKGLWGKEGAPPRIFNVGNLLTQQPIHPRGKSLKYQMD